MTMHLNRIPPVGPPQAYRSFVISAPMSTHRRAATCAEVDCGPYQHGWQVDVLPGSADEAAIKASGRRWDTHLSERVEGGFMRYVFPPGQPCFRASTHTVPLEREPDFLVRGGDHRGNPLGLKTVRHASAEDWRDDLGENQTKLIELRERG